MKIIVYKQSNLLYGGGVMNFADGKLTFTEFPEVVLNAPLEGFGHVKLFESVKELSHDQLVKLATSFELPTHPLLSTHSLMLMIAHHLQKAWYEKMAENGGQIPTSVKQNYTVQFEKYQKLVQNLVEGKETAVAAEKKAKTKKEKKERVSKTERKPLLYKVLSSKIDSKLAKKIEAKDSKIHDTIILEVLSEMDGDATLAAICGQVEATKRYNTTDDLDKSVKWHLNKLEKLGMIKATETA
jgi:hypothetical protein